MLTIDLIQAAAKRTFLPLPVVFAYIFGSTARGEHRPGSDVDIAVYLDKTVPSDGYLTKSLDIARALAAETSIAQIDVVVLNDAPLPLKGRAVRERIVIYSRDEPVRVEFESLTMRMFLDFQIHAEPLDRELLRRTAEGMR